MSFLQKIVPAVLVLLVPWLLARMAAAAPSPQAAGDYELSLAFVLGEESGSLTGRARILIPPDMPLRLSLAHLTITETLLRDDHGRENRLTPAADLLTIPPAPAKRTLTISYTRAAAPDADNAIGPAGIALIADWYPVPDQPMRYRLSAALPENFTAITEADTFPLARVSPTDPGNTYEAAFSRPVGSIHFVAGPYTIHKRQVRENLFVYAMLFAEDQELADGYLQAAAAFLTRYEREIGPFPYNHYVIVEGRRPTGLGMPTFTLLGQAVLRLPFIKSTSLGHEIVHSWFGNAVEVNYAGGNWCEGLTALLADHAYREDNGEGVADRRESITRYLSYVDRETAIPLAEFTSASHEQAMAEARRAVGYDRGALFFYELRQKIGQEAFRKGLQAFYRDNNGRMAGWPELEASFTAASGIDLTRFFTERLTRRDIPDLAVKDLEIRTVDQQPVLAFTLLQQTEKPYTLAVPVRIRTMAGEETATVATEALSLPVAIPLTRRPLELTIDPDHDFLRQLTAAEFPPVWSRFLGSREQLTVLGREEDRELFAPLLDSLGENVNLTLGDQVTDKQLADHDLLFLGTDQPRARALFGPPRAPAGFTLDVRHNPLAPGHVAALAASGAREETAAAARLLPHYGKYSSLAFRAGRNTAKEIQPVQAGLRFVLESLPQGGAASDLGSFAGIGEKLKDTRVIYVGEAHTTWADHLLQLRLIEALHRQDTKLAIGMEMFPATAQPVLDRYTRSREPFAERSFLKETDYYNVWRYDWRYYRDIVDFARTNALPVIGLNLDRRIVAEVFRSGGTDSLSPEARAALPPDRDLDMAGYTERLGEMYDMHVEGGHGGHGSGGQSGFVQAQAIWDETMAENIAGFLTKNPGYRMVVLAGNQHTRKDSGIPPRVARRTPVNQAVIVNAAGDRSPLDLARISDYYFLASADDLPEPPKIGVTLTPVTEDGRPLLKIDQISPHGKAGAAGLMAGDILVEVGGVAVTAMADLQLAMLDKRAGDSIGVKVRRTENGQERTLELQVELTAAPRSPPHP